MEEPAKKTNPELLVQKILPVGFLFLLLSSFFLYLSTALVVDSDSGSEVTMVLWMMLARLSGIGAFVIGVIAIFNNRWTIGVILLAGSAGLPFVSLFYHGHI